MNKYEKRFVIFDLFSTGIILGGCLFIISNFGFDYIVSIILIDAVHIFWVRPKIKRKFEYEEYIENIKDEIHLRNL